MPPKNINWEKLNRVDLKARNSRGEIILIEVQYQRQFDYLQRILHSSARTLVDHLPEDERRAYERYQDDLHQQASMVQSSYGVGVIQGRKLGREEGLKLGRAEERERIARAMLKTIGDDAMMAELTGLAADVIRRLRAAPES